MRSATFASKSATGSEGPLGIELAQAENANASAAIAGCFHPIHATA
jgi:hypothetical protein